MNICDLLKELITMISDMLNTADVINLTLTCKKLNNIHKEYPPFSILDEKTNDELIYLMEKISRVNVIQNILDVRKINKINVYYNNLTKTKIFCIDESYYSEFKYLDSMIMYYRSNDLPSVIRYKNNKVYRKEWYINGFLSRDEKNGPASIVYFYNGKIFMKNWMKDNRSHRSNEPALVYYFPDGKVSSKTWYENGIVQKSIYYYRNGVNQLISYYSEGKLYNFGDPAIFEYYNSGNIKRKTWYQRGKNQPVKEEYYEDLHM